MSEDAPLVIAVMAVALDTASRVVAAGDSGDVSGTRCRVARASLQVVTLH